MNQEHPLARRSAGAVVHNGRFMLHGGFGIVADVRPNAVHGDLWSWRTNWIPRLRRIKGQGFGNTFAGSVLPQNFRLQRRGWELDDPHGPPPARYPSLVSTGKEILRFGGLSFSQGKLRYLNDLWSWTPGGWKKIDDGATGPSPRYCAAAAYHNGQLFIFGGSGPNTLLNDVWVYVDGHWEPCVTKGPAPSPRYGFAWTQNNTGLYVFGGFDGTNDLDDFWILETESRKWLRAAAAPSPRFCAALGCTTWKGETVLFGGRSRKDSKRNLSDTWIFNGTWRKHEGPGPGYHAKAAYASDRNSFWLYGGEGSMGHVSDLWRFDEKGWHCESRARDDDPAMWS